MPSFGFDPVPKPVHKRNNPTAKQRGAITKKVYEAVMKRSGKRCERCGSTDGLQCAHLIRRWNVELRTTVNDVAMLCGPSVNTGTCHHYVDYTAKGKLWAENYRKTLYENAQSK